MSKLTAPPSIGGGMSCSGICFATNIRHVRQYRPKNSSIFLELRSCSGRMGIYGLSSHARGEAFKCEATTEGFHTLPDGMRLETILMNPSSVADSDQEKPILLFIHGSYHGAWCWAELFQPYFSNLGYKSVAVSLRGQGKSDKGDLKIAGTLSSHVNDLASVIRSLERPPVVIAHSFGGLLVEAYCSNLSGAEARPELAGVCLLSSVPPSGNKDIITRITKKSILNSFKITWGFITKSFLKNPKACRELFFSSSLPEDTLLSYQEKLVQNSSNVALLDVRNLSSELPIAPVTTSIFSDGKVKAFVGGGLDDMVVDPEAVQELAEYFSVEPTFWGGLAHDVMLDTKWETVAESLHDWLEEYF